MSPTIITIKVVEVERLNSTRSGGPRFKLWADDGSAYQIHGNASCAYEVENVIKVGNYYHSPRTVKLTLTKAGRFYDIKGV